MVQYYAIPGLGKVGSHYLAIATLSTLFGGIALMSGGSKAPMISQGPPINASSKPEEDFIQKFLKENDNSAKKH